MMDKPTTSDKMETFEGFALVKDWGDSSDVLFLTDVGDFDPEPLAETLWDLSGKNVTVRYWVCDQKCSKEEAQEDFLKLLDGAADIRFNAHYSDLTGYLWTDEDLNIGGHDLLAELKSANGKWVILEVTKHYPAAGG